MTVTVRVPPVFRTLTGGEAKIQVTGSTLSEVISALEADHPGFEAKLLSDDGTLVKYVNPGARWLRGVHHAGRGWRLTRCSRSAPAPALWRTPVGDPGWPVGDPGWSEVAERLQFWFPVSSLSPRVLTPREGQPTEDVRNAQDH
jgi:hypothetical protein